MKQLKMPHAGQCSKCRWATSHPWPPCSRHFWKKLSPVQKDAFQSGALKCFDKEEAKPNAN